MYPVGKKKTPGEPYCKKTPGGRDCTVTCLYYGLTVHVPFRTGKKTPGGAGTHTGFKLTMGGHVRTCVRMSPF